MCIDLIRKNKRKGFKVELSEAYELADERRDTFIDRHIFKEKIKSIKELLTPREFELLELRGQGYSYEEISEIAKTGISTARSTVCKARIVRDMSCVE